MRKLILSFLRPYVLQIMREHIKVTSGKNGVTGVIIASAEEPPPVPFPPITPIV